MINKTFSKIFTVFAAVVTIAIINLAASQTVSAQLQGAIFTSTGDGTTVNQNLYPVKADVYLNGGPQGMSNNGLPDGMYYFQVTNPSGSILLSTDPAVCRQFMVSGGRVAGATGTCPHLNGTFNPANGSTPVQLIPFLDTPNNGGEYKVHLIKQASTTTIAPDGIHINFLERNSKTDNFKVKVNCVDTPTLPICNPDPDPVTLSGHKFYDANANRSEDMGEVGVAGIQIVISYTTMDGTFGPFMTTTDMNGDWTYGPVPVGATYTVSENVPCIDDNNDMVCDPGKYWVQTAPAPDSMGFQGYSGVVNDVVTDLDFGDVCFGPASGGYTLGFWSNKNGQAIIKEGSNNFANSLLFLRNLNLKNANGSDFDPTTYPQFRTWLLSGNAVNMAYMLSVQLSATSLDVRYGFLSDGQMVDATSVGLGYISIGTVRTSANTSLNNYSFTISGDPHRASQEMMKNFLDGVNNNRLPFASATPCSVFYAPPAPIVP